MQLCCIKNLCSLLICLRNLCAFQKERNFVYISFCLRDVIISVYILYTIYIHVSIAQTVDNFAQPSQQNARQSFPFIAWRSSLPSVINEMKLRRRTHAPTRPPPYKKITRVSVFPLSIVNRLYTQVFTNSLLFRVEHLFPLFNFVMSMFFTRPPRTAVRSLLNCLCGRS